jgi:hypothetical protein
MKAVLLMEEIYATAINSLGIIPGIVPSENRPIKKVATVM